MLEQHIEYSEERGTWNLFVNGEWYLEGTYEQCEDAMFNNACDDDEYEEYEEDYEITPEDLHDYMYGI